MRSFNVFHFNVINFQFYFYMNLDVLNKYINLGGQPSNRCRDKDDRDLVSWQPEKGYRIELDGDNVERDLQLGDINLTAESCFACDACTQTAETRHKLRGCSVM